MANEPALKPIAPLFRRKWVYVALGLGLLCLASGAIEMWRGIVARQRFQPVEGRIRVSEPVSFGPKEAPLYRAQVEVAYDADGRGYTVPFSIPEVVSTRPELDDLLRRYRSGAAISLVYDPVHPYEVKLAVGSPDAFYLRPLILLTGGLVLLTSVVILAASDGRYHCPRCGAGVAELHAFCFMCGERIPTRKGKMAS